MSSGFSILIESIDPFRGEVLQSLTMSSSLLSKGGAREIDLSNLEDFDKDIKDIVMPGDDKEKADPHGICAFPQDTISSMREKIFISMGIPPYRQHITYTLEGVTYATYYISITDEIVAVNIEKDFKTMKDDRIGRYPLSRAMLNNRDDIEITTYETTTTLSNRFGTVSKIMVVDLFILADPSSPEVQAIVNHEFHRDIFFYGVVLRYYPMLTYEGFKHVYVSKQSIFSMYPLLHPPFKPLQDRLRKEGELLSLCMGGVPAVLSFIERRSSRSVFYLTRIVADVSFPFVNVRNLFDLMVLDEVFIYMCARIVVGGMGFFVEKRHGILFRDTFNRPNLQGISILIYTREGITILIQKNICTVEISFEESDRVSYTHAIDKIKETVAPILALLRRWNLSLIVEGEVSDDARVSIYSSDMVALYPETVDIASFKQFESVLDKYIGAGIIASRSSKPGEHSILFVKGTTLKSSIDNIYSTKNQYDQYINMEFRNKVALATYKQVNIVQRASDVAVYMPNFTEDEYEGISPLIMSMLHAHLSNRGPKKAIEVSKVNKVKRLQEIDPELFNFKKYDDSVPVYSVRCQAERQPFVYREEELEALPESTRGKLTKFRNFTDGSPLYYHCPNRKFPTLTFRPKLHPLRYCVPCCKKLDPSEGSYIEKANALCLKKFQLSEEDLAEIVSSAKKMNHVLSYSKIIPEERSSYIHPLISKWLGKAASSYFLKGVPQSMPSIDNAAMAHCLSRCLDMPMDEFIAEIARNLDSKVKLISALEIDKFGGINAFRDVLISYHVMGSIELSMDIDWDHIFEQMVRVTFGLDVFHVHDSGSKISLGMSKTASTSMRLGTPTRAVVLISHENGMYPVFRSGDGGKPSFIFSREDPLIMEIKKRILAPKRQEMITLELVLSYASKSSLFSLSSLCYGKRHLVYAVILKKSSKGSESERLVYVPVPYTEYIDDGIDISRGYPSFELFEREDILSFIAEYNSMMKMKVSVNYGLSFEGKAIALAYVFPGMMRKYSHVFFHRAMDSSPKEIRMLNVPYDLRDINAAIDGDIKTKFGEVDRYLYENYAYRLFIKEFAYLVKESGDKETRKKVIEIVSKSRINKKQLHAVLSAYPRDYRYMDTAISRYGPLNMPGLVRSTTFDFDRVLMEKLRDLPLSERKAEVSRLMRERIELTREPITISNVYVSCMEESQPQCHEGKLLMHESDLSYFIGLLAEDISIVHRYNVISVYASGIINALDFTRRAHENLSIEFIP